MGDSNLKAKTVSGVMWTALERFSTLVIQAVVGLVIAHFVSPEEFGLVGIITIFITICQVLVDSGFCSALIRKQDATDVDYSTVFYFNQVVSLVLYALAFLASPLVASFYGIGRLELVSKVAFLVLPLSALSLIQNAHLQKQMNFNALSKIGVSSVFLSAVVGLSLAVVMRNVWALVFQNLTYNLVRSLLLWAKSRWRPKWVFSAESLRQILPLSMSLMTSTLIGAVFDNLYGLVIGKMMNAHQLGLYSQADRLRRIPTYSVTDVVSKVAFPALSKLQDDDERMRIAYAKIIQTTFYVLLPIMVYLSCEAEHVIGFLLPDEWLPCAFYFSVLCIVGALYPLHLINLNILIVKDKGKRYFWLEVTRKTLLTLILIVSVSYGMKGILFGQLVYSFIVLFLNMYFSGNVIGYTVRRQWIDLLPIVFCALCICPVAYFIGKLSISHLATLLLVLMAGGIVYWGLSIWFKLKPYKELQTIIITKLNETRNKRNAEA